MREDRGPEETDEMRWYEVEPPNGNAGTRCEPLLTGCLATMLWPMTGAA